LIKILLKIIQNEKKMTTFWENIFRYPRFFVSTMIGLISIIISPFIYFFKKSDNTVIKVFFFTLCIGLLIFLLSLIIEY
jgi:hypothetical protein